MNTLLDKRNQELKKETIQLNARLSIPQMSIEDAIYDFDDSVLEYYLKMQFNMLGMYSDIDVESANRSELIGYMKQVKWERLRNTLNKRGTNIASDKQKETFERLYDKAILLGYDEDLQPEDKVDFMECMDKIVAFLDVANRIGNITIDQFNRLKSLYKVLGKENEFDLSKYEDKEQASEEIGQLIKILNDKASIEPATEKQITTIKSMFSQLGKKFTAKHKVMTKNQAKELITDLYEETKILPASDKQLNYLHRLADMAMTTLEDTNYSKCDCSEMIAKFQREIISAYGNYSDRQLKAMSDRQVSTEFTKIQKEQQGLYADLDTGVEAH